jgi:15-cis-phytoene synthase/lycopene beta-cyclase
MSLPTLYLWVIDDLALQRGTWVINKHTKLDLQLWGYLDVEYAAQNLSLIKELI